MKPLITLKPFHHHSGEQIGIYFQNNLSLNILVRNKAGAKWSQSGKCWYVPLNRQSYEKIKVSLPADVKMETQELRKYLENKNPSLKKPTTVIRTSQYPIHPTRSSGQSQLRISSSISSANKHILPAMKQMLKLKAFSPSTIRTYLNEMTQLLTTIKDIPADELKPEHLKRYLVYCYEKLGLKENTLHSRINAMKFYYEQVLKREKFFWEIPRPKKPFQLPKLLNENELAKLFNALKNKKHKAMLFTIYSAGLRVSELVNLKIADIDSTRMQIFIERGKGKKDRVVNLSPVLLDILRSYIKDYKPKPQTYLFESEQTLTAYPVRTVQQIFGNAKTKAGIRKEVGIHSLRHSFATHLLDKGTDIKYIKELLGHFDIKTTERYLHVSKKQLVNIASPFDDLWKNKTVEW
jgi:integrase/recombinase XerD